MTTDQWHWTEGGQPAGPGTERQLADHVVGGQVGADELVWCEGMANWTPVREVPAVARYLPDVATTVAAAAAAPPPVRVPAAVPMRSVPSGQLGYFSTSGSLPPRAAEALRGQAAPIGDVGDWPLDDGRVAQLVEAAKVRKPITDAAGLFRALFVLALIVAVCLLIGGLSQLAGGRRSQETALGLLVFAVGFGAVATLYYLAAWVTLRLRRWGAITMFVLFLLAVALVVTGFIAGSLQRRLGGAAVLVDFVSLIFIAAFAVYAGRAISAIPRYRRQPAWCQEVLIRAERRK